MQEMVNIPRSNPRGTNRGANARTSTTGNFHTLLMFKTDEELDTVRSLVHRMVERALALDGTCKACPRQLDPF